MLAAARVGIVLAATAIGGIAEARCPEPALTVDCGGIVLALETSELDPSGTLTGSSAVGVLPDGRLIAAESVETECDARCDLVGVRVWDTTTGHHTGAASIDGHGIHSPELSVHFAPPAQPGIAGVGVRVLHAEPLVGVTYLLPLSSERAVGAGVQHGTGGFAATLALFHGPTRSSRIDVMRFAGTPSFLISGRERLSLGHVAELSLDGSLSHADGRRRAAGTQRHFGPGREELVAALTTGGESGRLSVRYVGSRGALRHRDAVHLDAVIIERLRPFRTRTQIGATAASTATGFRPGAGASVVVEAPVGAARWTLTPRADLRAVGEQNRGSAADSSGASTGIHASVAPLDLDGVRLEVLGDADWGAELANAVGGLDIWNAPVSGWRAGAGAALVLGRAGRTTLDWRVTQEESAIGRAAHAFGGTIVTEAGSLSLETVIRGGRWTGTDAVAAASSRSFHAYAIAAARSDRYSEVRILGPIPLRTTRDRGGLESTAAIGFGTTVGVIAFETESGYTVGRQHGRGLGGRGRLSMTPPGRSWGLGAEGGRFVDGDVHAALHLHVGANPGLWLTHTR